MQLITYNCHNQSTRLEDCAKIYCTYSKTTDTSFLVGTWNHWIIESSGRQAEMLKSRKMKEGCMKNDKDEGWWFQAVEGFCRLTNRHLWMESCFCDWKIFDAPYSDLDTFMHTLYCFQNNEIIITKPDEIMEIELTKCFN